MQIQPRQEILDVWEAIAAISFDRGNWRWGGRGGRNSISDAEQLLCLLTPATEIPFLSLDDPDRTAEDVADSLARIGTRVQIPLVLMQALRDYLDTYTAADGTPIFSSADRFVVDDGREISAAQRQFELVDSYAVSVTLMLATLGFARVFRGALTREDLVGRAGELESMARRRLTAAMVGLLRSFAVHTFAPGSEFGRRQLRQVRQDDRPERVVADDLRRAMKKIRTRFQQDIKIGSGVAESRGLKDSDDLFECGWSWGVVREAPILDEKEGITDIAGQQDGVAEKAPYLYFTAVALEAIEGLFSERTQLLDLLDPVQARLADALRVRHQLTQTFWSRIATLGKGPRWPIEDVPWGTTDGLHYEYYSLLVGGMFVRERVMLPEADAELARIGDVFAELARRTRVTRRATSAAQAAVATHHPGDREPLRGSDTYGPPLAWTVADIAPLLLGRTLRLAGYFDAGDARDRVLELSDAIWQHLQRRKLGIGEVRGLWDQPGQAFPELDWSLPQTEVSWYHTKRMIDALVIAGRIVREPPRPSSHLAKTAEDMLIEADHLLHKEFFSGPGKRGSPLRDELEAIASLLVRARAVPSRTPGVVVAVVGEALRRLHQIAVARGNGDSAES